MIGSVGKRKRAEPDYIGKLRGLTKGLPSGNWTIGEVL